MDIKHKIHTFARCNSKSKNMPVKILSVDDEIDLELLLTQYFRRKIRKGEYEFIFAHDGLEALTMMLKHPDIEIILSDINMPEMDGLTLLAKINEMRNPALKVIMVSAFGDMDNIRRAMNYGAFDFAAKPIDLDDLSVTIEKAIGQINQVRQTQKKQLQPESQKGDLSMANEIKQAILPRVFPPYPELADKIDMAAFMTPAKDVGGDFYDFFHIDDNHLGFFIADVNGRGVPAAIFMAVSRTLIRVTGVRGGSAAECITYANKILPQESVDHLLMAVFYGILDTDTGEMSYCNAGHRPPYILKDNGEVTELPAAEDPMVGAYEGFKYHDASMKLGQGDMLLMYSEGVTGAVNVNKEPFGESRLKEALGKKMSKNCQETTNAVNADISAFTEGAEQSDDITVIALKKL